MICARDAMHFLRRAILFEAVSYGAASLTHTIVLDPSAVRH